MRQRFIHLWLEFLNHFLYHLKIDKERMPSSPYADRANERLTMAEFREEVLDALSRVPKGQVITFSGLGALVGAHYERMGAVISQILRMQRARGNGLPWWRVVYSGEGPVKDLLVKEPKWAAKQAAQLKLDGIDLKTDILKLDHMEKKEPVILQPLVEHKYSLIYLHGFGSCADNYADWGRFIGDDEELSFDWKIISPNAPVRETTYMKGLKCRSWYDYLLPDCLGRESEYSQKDLDEIREDIFKLVDAEVERVGASNVFIGGASQGCKTSLDVFLRYPQALGGYIGIVGFLLPTTPVPASHPARCIEFVCGERDIDVPLSASQKTFERLKHLNGFSLKVEGVDHTGGIFNEPNYIAPFLKRAMKDSARRSQEERDQMEM